MTLEQFLQWLRGRQGDMTQAQFALKLGISPQFLNDVYLRRREPGAKLLSALGLRKRVFYEEDLRAYLPKKRKHWFGKKRASHTPDEAK